MAKIRHGHQRKIDQAMRANDKTLHNIMILMETFNATGLSADEILSIVIDGDGELPDAQYTNILLPLVTAIYFIQEIDECLGLVRKQI